MRRNSKNKLLKILSASTLAAIMAGGAIAFSLPSVQSKVADNLVNKSTIYQAEVDKNAELIAENDELKAERDEKQAALDKANADLTAARTTLADVNVRLTTAQNDLTAANAAKVELQASLAQANADKEELQAQLDTATEDKEAIQAQYDAKVAEIATINADIEAKNAQIESLQADVASLTGEKNTLQTAVNELNEAVDELQARVDELESDLAEYEQITITIDQTYPVEAIIVTNTKDGTIYVLQNPETITTLKLYSWEDVSIKYAEADNLKVFVNGVEQDNLTVTVNGTNNEDVEIITVQESNVSKFMFNGNTLTRYNGNDENVVIPSSYSIGDVENIEQSFTDFEGLYDYCLENGYNFSFNKDGELITVSSREELFSNRRYINDIINTDGQITVNLITQKYVDGDDFTVTTIGDYAFNGCDNLTSIEIPDSVTAIGNFAFGSCENLTSITIPNSVTTIGANAFNACNNLTSINIPDSVISIGVLAFGSCESLTSITVSPNNAVYDSRDNCNAIIETSTNVLVTGCQNTIIPNGVTKIGRNAFIGCKNLTSISMPNGVTVIENGAFISCVNLTSVDIPNSVTSIEAFVFTDCQSLTSIEFDGTVAQWNAITKGDNWNVGVPATEVVCTDGTVTL